MLIGLKEAIIILILGFCTGIFSGFFGIGGAILLTPMLNIMGVPMVNAIASDLAFTVGASSVGMVKHFFMKHVYIKLALLTGFMAVLGVRLAYPVVLYLNEKNLADTYIRSLFILLLLLLGLLTWNRLRRESLVHQRRLTIRVPPLIKIGNQEISFWLIALIGFFVGFLKGIMGVGGGFILVPLFIIILNLDPHLAAGTSLGVTFISSIFGAYFYFTAGLLLPLLVVLLLGGAFLGLQIGTEANQRAGNGSLLTSFTTFLFLMALGLLIRQLGFTRMAFFFTFSLCILFSSYIFYHDYLQRTLPLPLIKRR